MARLTFSATSDDFALDVRREGSATVIGFLQWHRGREPHFIQWTGDGCSLTIDEMEQIVEEYKTSSWRSKQVKR